MKEVDATGRLPLSASLDPALLNDVSIIAAPPGTRSPRASPRTRSASPIRAGLGVCSPSFIPKRSPSPLRQSTMLDLKSSTSSTTPALAQPRRSPRAEFQAPTPRLPGSSHRPRAASKEGRGRATATTPQPARKALPVKKVLKHSVSVGVLPSTSQARARSTEAQGRGFMAATQSSRTRVAGAPRGAAQLVLVCLVNGRQEPFGFSATRPHVQGGFFDWSSLNLAMFKSLYKIPYSNFFSKILLLGPDLGVTSRGRHPVQDVVPTFTFLITFVINTNP